MYIGSEINIPLIPRRRARGFFKYLVLYSLRDKQLHGYGVMQEIERILHGQYSPSPGIVYPTLQLLEDMGYLKSTIMDGKRVYTITEEGKRVLEKNIGKVKKIIENSIKFKKFIVDLGGKELFSALMKLFKVMPTLDAEKVARIRVLIEDFGKRLLEEIEER